MLKYYKVKQKWLYPVICLVILLPACKSAISPDFITSQIYRLGMRDFIQQASNYAKSIDPEFIIITQNGLELLTENSRFNGKVASGYLNKIDGVGQEHVFYGADGYEIPTTADYRNYLIEFLDLAERQNLAVLVTDYCELPVQVDDSYSRSSERNYISFAASSSDFDLDEVPEYPAAPYGVNSLDITNLPEAKNFLYLINSSPFENKNSFLSTLTGLNYDVLIIDPFYEKKPLTESDIQSLQTKANGGKRLVLAYLNIGAAEEFRYYWQNDWEIGNPSWIAARYSNPLYYNEFWVKYWEKGWRDIIYGNDNSFLKKILDSGFDGVYLDNIEAFDFFESL